MLLRPASTTDIPALVELSRKCFVAAFGHLYAPEDLQSFLDTERSAEKLGAAIRDPDTGVVLAEDSADLIGYCIMYFDASFPERPAPQPARAAILSQLYCVPQATGRGVGAALIEWAIGEAGMREREAIQLSVYSENFGAQRFYQRYGFAKVADIAFWVGSHRDDEFLYELTL
ncbi:GNAT family N-acetyltransferase [Tsuneonella suprasediminis]|uniref:GNAT family N-acetyltransferase n=1 Tax=Tsuneonella suprasediminis TaxID=2306996 RepID=UPI002F927083